MGMLLMLGSCGLLALAIRRRIIRSFALPRLGTETIIAMRISGQKTASMLWRPNIANAGDIRDAGKRTERYLKAQRGAEHANLPTDYFDGL